MFKNLQKFSIPTLLVTCFISSQAWGYGTGAISYPWSISKKAVAVEFSGITSSGGGAGLQGRYTHKVAESIILDAGAGLSGGERSGRAFLGADFEVFPDYAMQPRLSIKTVFEHSKEFRVKRNIISVAPTISKGFNFWGKEAFPFFSMPVGLSLDTENKRYETSINANLGLSGNLPIKGYEKFLGTFEATIKIKDSYSGFFVGIAFPLM